jgi:biopolymer transport protein ExbD
MRRRRGAYHSEDTEEAEINLTPLIDVVFVVLIMFIIIAPLLEMDRIKLASGPSHDEKQLSSVQEMSQVHIHVREDNTILLNGRALVLEQLRTHLKQTHLRSPRAIPQLYHDKRAFFGTYQEVKNAVEEAGFEELEIILKPK